MQSTKCAYCTFGGIIQTVLPLVIWHNRNKLTNGYCVTMTPDQTKGKVLIYDQKSSAKPLKATERFAGS